MTTERIEVIMIISVECVCVESLWTKEKVSLKNGVVIIRTKTPIARLVSRLPWLQSFNVSNVDVQVGQLCRQRRVGKHCLPRFFDPTVLN